MERGYGTVLIIILV